MFFFIYSYQRKPNENTTVNFCDLLYVVHLTAPTSHLQYPFPGPPIDSPLASCHGSEMSCLSHHMTHFRTVKTPYCLAPSVWWPFMVASSPCDLCWPPHYLTHRLRLVYMMFSGNYFLKLLLLWLNGTKLSMRFKLTYENCAEIMLRLPRTKMKYCCWQKLD